MKYFSSLIILIVCAALNLNAQVQVSIIGSQKQHTISPMIQGFGLIYCFEADDIYGDGDMANLFKEVGAGFLRYPGGAVTTMYHWNDLNGQGWIDSWNGTYDRINDPPPEDYMDLDEYMALCVAADTEPMLGINLSSGRNYNRQEDGVNEAVAMLKYCNEMSYDVKYLYLDNENHHKHWTPEEYGNQILYYVDSIKKYAPEASLIANWTDKFRNNKASFTTLLNIAGDHMDYMDVHWYWKWTEGSWNEWIAKTPMENETEWYDGGTFAEEIDYFNDLMQELGKPHIKLASMEWNLGPGKYAEDPLHNNFKTALMQSEMQMQMMQGGLEIGSLWSTQWPNDDESDFRFLVSSSNNYEPTPTAEFFRLYKHALNGVLVDSHVTDSKVMVTSIIKDDNKALVYILNKNSVSTPLNVSLYGYSFLSLSQALTFKDPGIVEEISVEENNFSYSAEIPGYSLTMIEFDILISDESIQSETGQDSQLQIWPNPASENILVRSSKLEGTGKYHIYNILGKQVLGGIVDQGAASSGSLSVKQLPTGCYHIVLSDERGRQSSGKLMVN
jgi:alpha-L-arabinofuranosidase